MRGWNSNSRTHRDRLSPGANVTVFTQAACGSPATSQATLYHNAQGTGSPVQQPIKTDGFGQAYAYAAPGCYTTIYVSSQTGTITRPDQIVGGNGPPGPQGPQGIPGTGNITASPQFTMMYQPFAGTQSAAQGDANVTTDGAGNTKSKTTASSVNAVIYVKAPPYNAKCDGTTDDQAAIQAAFNDAKNGSTNPLCTAGGCSVQFPAGRCVTSTITWVGQSFFGAGKDITYIRGKPGQDIFQVPDTTGTFIGNGFVHDFSMEIDVTVNAAASAAGGNNTFPNRIAGTWQGTTAFNVPIAPGAPVFGQSPCGSGVNGASATAGTTTVALNCSFPFSMDLLIDPALVIGTQITITGAGAAGADYHSTITAYNAANCDGHHATGCTLTVADPIGTTVSKVAGTFLNAHTPPWYIGNAGFALQCANSGACYGNANTRFSNIEFRQFGSSLLYMNHCAGIFSQMAFYAARFDHLHFWSLYGGYIEAIPPTTPSVWTADTATYSNIDFSTDLLPMITYNGNDRVLSDINIYQETPLSMGPFFLTKNQITQSGNATWTINSLYEEGGPSTAGEFARFMSGPYFTTSSNFGGGNSTSGTGGGSWAEFTAGGNTTWYGTISGAIHIDVSNMNTFINPGGVLYDNGLGNKSEQHYGIVNSPYLGRMFYDPNAKPPRSSVGLIDGSFLLSGNSSAPYLNASDLITTCEDWPVVLNPSSSGGAAGTCVNDPSGTELTRHYYHSLGPTTVLSLANNNPGVPAYAWSGTPRTLGTNFPQSKINVIIMARCVGAGCAATVPFRLRDTTTGTYLLPNPALTMTLTSAWSQQSAAFDLTGTTYGHILDFRIDSVTNTGTNYDIAYVAFQPQPGSITSLALNSSGTAFDMQLQAPASVAATYIVKGPETGTAGSLVDKVAGATVIGHLASFTNVTGRIGDSGTTAGSDPSSLHAGGVR